MFFFGVLLSLVLWCMCIFTEGSLSIFHFLSTLQKRMTVVNIFNIFSICIYSLFSYAAILCVMLLNNIAIVQFVCYFHTSIIYEYFGFLISRISLLDENQALCTK